MATRNLTKGFVELRSRRSRKKPKTHSQSSNKHLLEDENGAIELESPRSIDAKLDVLPPEWVDIVDRINADLETLEDKSESLKKLYRECLKVTFEQGNEKEQEIEICTSQVTRLFKKCDSNLKRIASVGNLGDLPVQERVVRLNVMRAMAQKLSGLSKEFRAGQRNFLAQRKQLHSSGKEFFEEKQLEDLPGMDQQQMLQDLDNEFDQRAKVRQKEITKVVQSINELAILFREISILVIEQGTVLDRIDYNVESVLTRVGEGTQQLIQAKEYQDKTKSWLCILILLVFCAILIGILVMKHDD